MKRIEMVGPPGVGKTTLYNEICQIPMHSRSYQILKEAYKDAAIYVIDGLNTFTAYYFAAPSYAAWQIQIK